MIYEFSSKAVVDLEDIYSYTIHKWSIDQANLYYELLFTAIEEICISPKHSKSLEYIKPNLFSRVVKSHLIIYQIQGDVIFIARILHGKMDLKRQLI